jgi:hypothetical protein
VKLLIASVALPMILGGCAAHMSDAEQTWCADHPRSVATSMQTLNLLTPIEGESDFELWVAVLDGYFQADPLRVNLLTDTQRDAADRGCRAAFEAR